MTDKEAFDLIVARAVPGVEHDAQSSQRYKENWDDAVQASKNDAAEIAELKEAYALLFKAHAAERERCATACEALPSFGPDNESAEWYGFALLACAAAIRGPNVEAERPAAVGGSVRALS